MIEPLALMITPLPRLPFGAGLAGTAGPLGLGAELGGEITGEAAGEAAGTWDAAGAPDAPAPGR